jgi:hypothetical protein
MISETLWFDRLNASRSFGPTCLPLPSIPKLKYVVMGRDADTDGVARRRGREAAPTDR